MDAEIEKKLRAILIQVMGCCDSIPDKEELEAIEEAMSDIEALVVGTIPADLFEIESDAVGAYKLGQHDCRNEMLSRWTNKEKL